MQSRAACALIAATFTTLCYVQWNTKHRLHLGNAVQANQLATPKEETKEEEKSGGYQTDSLPAQDAGLSTQMDRILKKSDVDKAISLLREYRGQLTPNILTKYVRRVGKLDATSIFSRRKHIGHGTLLVPGRSRCLAYYLNFYSMQNRLDKPSKWNFCKFHRTNKQFKGDYLLLSGEIKAAKTYFVRKMDSVASDKSQYLRYLTRLVLISYLRDDNEELANVLEKGLSILGLSDDSHDGSCELDLDAVADFYLHLGLLRYLEKKNQAAKQYFTLAISSKPDFAMAICMLGVCESKLGNKKEGLNYLKQSCSLTSNLAFCFNYTGLVHIDHGDYSLAEESFKSALLVDPTNSDTHTNIGLLFLSQGDHTRAIDWFDKSILLDPAQDRAYLYLAHAAISSGNYAEALVHYDKAIALLESRDSIEQCCIWRVWCLVKM